MIEINNNRVFFDLVHAHRDILTLRAVRRQHGADLKSVRRKLVFRNLLKRSGIDRSVGILGLDHYFFLPTYGHPRELFF